MTLHDCEIEQEWRRGEVRRKISSIIKSGYYYFLIPFYLQAVEIYSANGVELLEA
jgi:hypothetical protein